MAKNWKPIEAAEAIKGNEVANMIDFGRRFPLATIAISQLNEAGIEILKALPDFMTMRKLESGLKGELEAETEVEAEEEVETPAPKAKAEKPAKKAKVEEEDEDEAEEEVEESAKDLFMKCKKLKIEVEPYAGAAYYKKAIAHHEAEEAKKVKEARQKPAPKPAKKDEEDDWDL